MFALIYIQDVTCTCNYQVYKNKGTSVRSYHLISNIVSDDGLYMYIVESPARKYCIHMKRPKFLCRATKLSL